MHPVRQAIIAVLGMPALGLGGTGLAAASGDQQRPITAGEQRATTSGGDQRGVARSTSQAMARDVRASKLMGMEIRNRQNENLGNVQDLVLDVNSGKVRYAIVSFGGFLGLGDKHFAYPLSTFTAATGDKLVLNVDKTRLERAPGLERTRAKDWSDGRYLAEVDRYFGVPSEAMAPGALRRASELIGKDVDGRDGKDIAYRGAAPGR